MKHFRACHKESKRQIEFDLWDIAAVDGLNSYDVHRVRDEWVYLPEWILEYNHQGSWYPYGGEGSV